MLRPALALALCLFLIPASASAAPSVIFSSDNLTTPIVDVSTVDIPIDITAGEILTARVKVNLSHTFDSDLDLYLVTPDGALVELSTGNGGSGDNFGSGSNCSGGFTTFDDAAATGVTAGTAPFLGSFRPEGLLSAVAGTPLQGTWKLRVTDDVGGDSGTVWCWQLEVVPAQADISVTSTDSPDPAKVGSNLVYTSVVTNAGPDPTSNVKLIDTLPGGVEFVSAVTPGGTCTGQAVVVCDLRPLAAADQETVTITVRPTAPGTLTNRVTVSQVAGEPVGAVGAHIDFDTTGVSAANAPGCTLTGTSGADVLVGTSGADVICGLGGNDTIKGLGRSDKLVGGAGNDKLVGGAGVDRLLGGAGRDTLTGSRGKDVLSGQGGADLLLAKDGVRDTVNGGSGRDRGRLDRGLDKRISVERLV
jgi:uncharacterized repeat protein (TIGR01451 family)